MRLVALWYYLFGRRTAVVQIPALAGAVSAPITLSGACSAVVELVGAVSPSVDLVGCVGREIP